MLIWKQQFPLSCDLSHFLKRITLESVTIEDPELSQVNKCQTTIQCAVCAWHIDSNMAIFSPGRAERVVTLHWGHPDRDGVLCIYIAYSTYEAIPRSKPFKTYIIYILHMNNTSCTFWNMPQCHTYIYIHCIAPNAVIYIYIHYIYIYYIYIYIYTNISNIFKYYIHIRRPRPSPRPGRRLGPPEVWILSFLNPCHAQRCRQKPPQGHSNGSRAPHGRSNGFFYRRSRLPFARPQTLQTFQLLGKGTPISPTRATPAGKSHHKATAMAQEHPTAAAMASYRRSRLPFARPQTLQTLQRSAQLRREKVPQQAQHAPPPQAKATTRPQQWLKSTPRPQQWLLIGVQGCRLPGLKPSKPSKSPPSSAGKRYPNKLNTRHARRQKPPQGHSNGSRAPPGRSNGFL